MDLAVSRIGELAFSALRLGKCEWARNLVEVALRDRPDWVRLKLIHAHACMLTARITLAMELHRKYGGRRMESGESWGEAIRTDFIALRRAGYHLPIMNEIKRQFAAKP
jgi:hypothetical protein